MKEIHIEATNSYTVYIDQKLLDKSGSYISKVCAGKNAAVISDSNVFPLYGAAATESLKSAGFQVVSFVFPAGEESKNGANYLNIVNFLAENHLTRSDCLVALYL